MTDNKSQDKQNPNNKHNNDTIVYLPVEPFIVVNTGNTCYIDSLLMALFFTPSCADYLLKTNIKDGITLYLQELIKVQFVDMVRHSKSVSHNTVDIIRNCCYEIGWRNESKNEIFLQQDVSEFYMFLLDKLKGTQIKIQRETITEALRSKDDIGKEVDIPYIPLGLPNDITKDITIKKMLHDWMYDNLKEVNRFVITEKGKEHKNVPGLDVKHIVNAPKVIALSINRFQNRIENGKIVIRRNSTGIDIQRKISPFHNKQMIHKHEWEFQSAICHRGDTMNSGHYYTLLHHNNKYYVFDDLNTPSIIPVKMEDTNVTNVIKKECIFLIYRLIS